MTKRKLEEEYRQAEDAFAAHLEKQGLKMTSQRRAVLKAVLATHEHFSVEELYLALKGKRGVISLASLYRTMPILVESSLVQAVRFGDETRYEHCFGHSSHDHLICLGCGKIIEIEEKAMDKVEKRASQANDFQAVGRNLVISGYCRQCRRRGRKILLSEMSRGDMGKIVELRGGEATTGRLRAMGLRTGKQLIKVSTMFGGGPTVVQISGTQVAVGRGLAKWVVLELED